MAAFVPAAAAASRVHRQAPAACLSRGAFVGAPVTARATPAPVVAAAATPRMGYNNTIHENLKAAGVFKTLIAAAAASDAYGAGTKGNFMVFAPSDAAFARLRPGTLEALLAPGKEATLRAIVKRHVVPGNVLTLQKMKGVGYFEGVEGGPLPYEALGGVIRVGNALVQQDRSNIECSNGIIHVIDSVLVPPSVTPAGVFAGYQPAKPALSDSVAETYYAQPSTTMALGSARARGASTAPGTTSGRKAMGLVKQLPFWAYGPPYNAAYQEDYEPISIAAPDVAAIDYQVFPPGSVVVVPDSVNAGELNPVSGYSKYIGKTKRNVEGAAISEYSKLDN